MRDRDGVIRVQFVASGSEHGYNLVIKRDVIKLFYRLFVPVERPVRQPVAVASVQLVGIP